nr:hypothetical protein CFP56_36220 [Quercus suber]
MSRAVTVFHPADSPSDAFGGRPWSDGVESKPPRVALRNSSWCRGSTSQPRCREVERLESSGGAELSNDHRALAAQQSFLPLASCIWAQPRPSDTWFKTSLMGFCSTVPETLLYQKPFTVPGIREPFEPGNGSLRPSVQFRRFQAVLVRMAVDVLSSPAP